MLSRMPMAAGQALIALDFALGPSQEVVLCDGKNRAESDRLWTALQQKFVPNKFMLPIAKDNPSTDANDLTEGKTAINGEPTIYICDHGACHAPVHGAAAVKAALSGGFDPAQPSVLRTRGRPTIRIRGGM